MKKNILLMYCCLLASLCFSQGMDKQRIKKQEEICKQVLSLVTNEKYDEALTFFVPSVQPDLKSANETISEIKRYSFPLALTTFSEGKYVVHYGYYDLNNDKKCYLSLEFSFSEDDKNYKIIAFKLISQKELKNREKEVKNNKEVPPEPPK